MDDILREFLLETTENLAQLDLELVALEQNPRDAEILGRIFRTIHSAKGAAGFLGYDRLTALAHASENLLHRLRTGQMLVTPSIISLLLRVVDGIRKRLTYLDKHQTDAEVEDASLLASLHQAVGEAKAVESAAPVVMDEEADQPVFATTTTTDSTIRVDVGLLDKLMNLVGELVLARNQIVQLAPGADEPIFARSAQRLNYVTGELQAGVMKTRLQSIGSLWSKFPRLVRDLALACGKQVRLEMEGSDTELDKTIVEAIRDPLTHVIRNAVDHGIERPTARHQAGKPEKGRILLRASHEGGKVNIEVSDDGAGIDPRILRQRALNARLLTPQQASQMSEHELLQLIFLPGFSTAETVTEISGRGVGMDVVRCNVEKIGGSVDFESQAGRGCTVRMKIPLTLAIIPALSISTGDDRFAIPQANLIELVHLDRRQKEHALSAIQGAPVLRLRDQLLPVVHLSRELELAVEDQSDDTSIIIVQADDRKFGLVVDQIHDTEEIVVKPLQAILKGVTVFSGATILGDGSIALILDMVGLAHKAGVLTPGRQRIFTEKAAPAPVAEQHPSMLLCAAPGGGRLAIPVDRVARLEEFPVANLERSGPFEVVQYRGEILSLIRVDRVLHERRRRQRPTVESLGPIKPSQETIQVVVHSNGDRRVGLVMGRILDIVDEPVTARTPASRKGVLYSGVLQGRITEFLDVDTLVRQSELYQTDTGEE